MKLKVIGIIVVLAIGYGLGRLQAPPPQEPSETITKVQYKAPMPPQSEPNDTLIEAPQKIKRQKTLADVYKPKKQRRLSREHILKRVKKLKQYKPSDFEHVETESVETN